MLIVFTRMIFTGDLLELVTIEAIVFEIVNEKIDFFFEERRSRANAVSTDPGTFENPNPGRWVLVGVGVNGKTRIRRLAIHFEENLTIFQVKLRRGSTAARHSVNWICASFSAFWRRIPKVSSI